MFFGPSVGAMDCTTTIHRKRRKRGTNHLQSVCLFDIVDWTTTKHYRQKYHLKSLSRIHEIPQKSDADESRWMRALPSLHGVCMCFFFNNSTDELILPFIWSLSQIYLCVCTYMESTINTKCEKKKILLWIIIKSRFLNLHALGQQKLAA